MAILNEVYVGRLPEIDQMVTDIHNIREEYKAKGNISVLKTTKVFEKHVEEMWGFKAFLLDIYISQYPNAYTRMAGSCIDCNTGSVIECTNKGYRFSKDSNISALTKIATSILSSDLFTDEEVTAILLHEIGHSFAERAEKINKTVELTRKSRLKYIILLIILSIMAINPFYLKIGIRELLYSNTFTNTLIIKVSKAMKNVPGLRHLNMGMKELGNFITETINNWLVNSSRKSYDKNTLKRLEKLRKKGENTLNKNKLSDDLALARSNERLADDFGNMYGLGVALASGLLKMGSPYKFGNLSKSDPTDLQKKIDDCVIELYATTDAHPGNCDRLLAMIDALEEDYKTLEIDKRIKDQMWQDIKALKKMALDIKKQEGIIKEYNNKYMEKSASDNIKKGNTETKKEKKYNDRKQVNKDWEKNKIDID